MQIFQIINSNTATLINKVKLFDPQKACTTDTVAVAYAPLTRKQTNKLLTISCRPLNSRAASQSLKE